MTYKVLSLKWRPQCFEDVVGQNHVTQTLINAINLDKIGQAYLFTGPRGVGKTTTARVLAMAINSSDSPSINFDPDSNESREIAAGRSIDVLEIDGASNRGIEEIRNLREQIKFPPMNAKFKIIIIDEVHMLTTQAFNALLRTLEEPPSHGKFIFATTDIHKVPDTIISRCQRFDFNRIAISIIVERLQFITKAENFNISKESIFLISKKADGSMRDALSLLDQVIAYCGDSFEHEKVISALGVIRSELFFQFTDAILNKDYKRMALFIEDIANTGTHPSETLVGLREHLKYILYAGIDQGNFLLDIRAEDKKKYIEEYKKWNRKDLFYVHQILIDASPTIKNSDSPFLLLEMILFKILEMENSIQLDNLINKIEQNINNNESFVSKGKTNNGIRNSNNDFYKKKFETTNPKGIIEDDQKERLTKSEESEKINLDLIKKNWNKIIKVIQKKRPSISAMFEDYNLESFMNNKLILKAKNNQNYNEKILKNGLDILKNEISSQFNTQIIIETVNIEDQKKGKKSKDDLKDPTIVKNDDEVFNKVVDLFDGEILR
ncbi:MAG: hypothetical protein CMG55_10755 [Candidatus Marinimicrobia bacterium]|nr:hypothetical protein [Candidatus Neomarinimicrobiota bacterium]|tara:strand:+ start:1473 stop:3128 length:1656 start_codon:yes stop_codon:yes gene_type:complete